MSEVKLEIGTDNLRDLLREGVVDFEYEKKDGTLREAKGTLSPNHIPEDQHPQSDREKDLNGSNLKYWDLDRNAWRALSSNTEVVNLLK